METIDDVMKLRDNFQTQIVKMYQKEQQLIFNQMNTRLFQIDEKVKLIDYFNKLTPTELYKRYSKRHKQMIDEQGYLTQFMLQY